MNWLLPVIDESKNKMGILHGRTARRQIAQGWHWHWRFFYNSLHILGYAFLASALERARVFGWIGRTYPTFFYGALACKHTRLIVCALSLCLHLHGVIKWRRVRGTRPSFIDRLLRLAFSLGVCSLHLVWASLPGHSCRLAWTGAVGSIMVIMGVRLTAIGTSVVIILLRPFPSKE